MRRIVRLGTPVLILVALSAGATLLNAEEQQTAKQRIEEALAQRREAFEVGLQRSATNTDAWGAKPTEAAPAETDVAEPTEGIPLELVPHRNGEPVYNPYTENPPPEDTPRDPVYGPVPGKHYYGVPPVYKPIRPSGHYYGTVRCTVGASGVKSQSRRAMARTSASPW